MSEATPLSLLDHLRLQPRDGDSWRRLLDLYTAWLQGWTRRLSGLGADDPDVAEVVQNVFAAAFSQLPKFKHNGRTGAFRTWLKAILLNCLRDRQRQRRRMPAAESESLLEQFADPKSGLSREWEKEHLTHVIGKLFERGKKCFTEYAWNIFERTVLDAEPASQVAQKMSVSVNAVLLAKSRVLAWLRREGGELLE